MATDYVVEAAPIKKTWLQRLEVDQPTSGLYKNTQYVNPDIVPMGPERRTWGPWAFVLYWMVAGFSVVNYTAGSALIAYGLSGPQAVGATVLGAILLGFTCVGCGWWGSSHHLSYMGAQRFTWGMRGSYFPIAVRCVPAIIWDGIEALWGGQAVAACLGALSPRFAHWDATIAGGTLLAKDGVGFIIFYVFFLATMLLKPEKLKIPFMITTALFVILVFAMLIWAVGITGNSGPYFAKNYVSTEIASGNTGWAFVFGSMATLSNFAGATLGQSDWTRFSRKGMAPTYIQLIACPLSIIAVSTIGIVVTSCVREILGEPIWQPYALLSAIQAHYGDSPRARAAVFFGGLAAGAAQVNANIVLNSVSMGMDMAALAPKYINIRRAAYIIAALGLATNPWHLTASAGTFLNVLGGFGIFYGPMMGLMIAEFFIVRRRRLHLEHIYLPTKESVYWYWKGLNIRAVVVFFVTLVPSFPGFVMGLAPNFEYNNWVKMSRFTLLLGIAISVTLHTILNLIWPAVGAGEGELRHNDDTFRIPGQREPGTVKFGSGSADEDTSSVEKKA